MNPFDVRRLSPALSLTALVLALLALLATAAGVGYAAGQVGTAQLKNNAVTTPKIKKNAVNSSRVKNGSLKAADLVKEEKQKKPKFNNGGEGDCKWMDATSEIAGSGPVRFRKEFHGRIIMTGIVVGTDGPGGDADCDSGAPGQVADGIAFTLPAGYIPAKTQYLFNMAGIVLIAGPNGYSESGTFIPAGSVFISGSAAILDGVSFDPAGSKVVTSKTKASGRFNGRLLKALSGN